MLHWEREKHVLCTPTHPSKYPHLILNVQTLFPVKVWTRSTTFMHAQLWLRQDLQLCMCLICATPEWRRAEELLIFNCVFCRSLCTHPSRIWNLSFARFAWQRKEQYWADQEGTDLTQVGILWIFSIKLIYWWAKLSYNSSSYYIGSQLSYVNFQFFLQ